MTGGKAHSLTAARDHDADIANVLVEWIDLDPTARFIVNADLTLVWASSAAVAMLEAATDIELRNGAVTIRARSRQPEFVDFVAGCGPALATLCLPSDEGFLLLRGREIRGDGGIRHIAISARHSAAGLQYRYADLDTAFGFSRAEHRVAMKMMEGSTAEEIADEAGLSIATVRTQIRNIYLKADVTSREALFARFAPFRM